MTTLDVGPVPASFAEVAGGLYIDEKPEETEHKEVVEKEVKTGDETKTVDSEPTGDGKVEAPVIEIKVPTKEEIVAEVKADLAKQVEEKKEYTPEEIDKIFKIWKPSEEFATRLLAGGTDAVGALVEMRDALQEQMRLITGAERNNHIAQLEEKFAPALTMAQEKVKEKEENIFYDSNKDLLDKKELVNVVWVAMQSEGYEVKSVEQARKDLADRTRKLIPGSASGQSANGEVTKTSTTKEKPASLSNGSQTGGGSGSPDSAKGNVFQEIFGK